mgnify:CR=1 FL=1
MKIVVLILSCFTSCVFAQTYYATNYLWAAPPAGYEGSTAVPMSETSLVSWASGFTNLVYGDGVSEEWKTPALSLGPAEGTIDDVVSLGRAGVITLSFPRGIRNGPGFDFAVFENSFSDGFLELAYVEVSSDGIYFVRFPHYSDEKDIIPGFYLYMTADYYFGLAGKYRGGFGTPFDLEELAMAAEAIALGQTDFTPEFIAEFSSAFAHLDLDAIRYVRLVDVVGNGNSPDARGAPIYDPYSTGDISAGFDLDAVGVINEMALPESAIPLLQLAYTNETLTLRYAYDQNWFEEPALEFSTNLVDWSRVPPSTNGVKTHGDIHSVITEVDGELHAAGFYRLLLPPVTGD